MNRFGRHQFSLYNPGQQDDESVKATFVARQSALESFVDEIAKEGFTGIPQHHLIVGLRGMGKTTMLQRIAIELRSEPYAQTYIPLVFAEEQYKLDRLARFWMSSLDSLADHLEQNQDHQKALEIDEKCRAYERSAMIDRKDLLGQADGAYKLFQGLVSSLGRRPVLLVDNFQMLLTRLSDEEQSSLRAVLSQSGCPIILGAAPYLPEEAIEYEKPFFDFFKVRYLENLSTEEMLTVIEKLADLAGKTDLIMGLRKSPGRMEAIHSLTGGNPRTTAALFHLYSSEFSPSAVEDIDHLLDLLTPYYKALMEELPDQAQVVTAQIAEHWDPITSAVLAERCGLPNTTISSQLNRLEFIGTIRKVALEGLAQSGFMLSERFFNIWFLMRNSSRRNRHKVQWLARCMQALYDQEERRAMALKQLESAEFDSSCIFTIAAATLDVASDHGFAERLIQRASEKGLSLEMMRDLIDLNPTFDAAMKSVDLNPNDHFNEGLYKLFNQLGEAVTRDRPKEILDLLESLLNLPDMPNEVMAVTQLFKGLNLRKLELFEEAIACYNLALELPTKTIEVEIGALFQKGVALDCLGQFEEAISCFQSIIDNPLSPSHDQINSLSNMGFACDSLGRIEDAISCFNAVIVHAEASVSEVVLCLVSKGVSLAKAMRFDAAISCFDAVITKPEAPSENIAEALSLKGLALAHAGRMEDSISYCNDAINFEGASVKSIARSYRFKGIALDKLTRYEEAIVAFNVVIDLVDAPIDDVEFALRSKGNLLERLGRFDEVVSMLEAIIADENTPVDMVGLAFTVKGIALGKASRFEEALTCFNAAIDLDGIKLYDLERAWLGKGFCLVETKRLEDSIDVFNSIIQNPKFSSEAIKSALLAKSAQEKALGKEVDSNHSKSLSAIVNANWVPELRTLIFRRDVEGDISGARDYLNSVTMRIGKLQLLVESGLFSAYAENWGEAQAHFADFFTMEGVSVEEQTSTLEYCSAVLVHLGYGEKFVKFMIEKNLNETHRIWFEAIRAILYGSSSLLRNVAPEVAKPAKTAFDRIQRLMEAFSPTTKNWSPPTRPKTKRTRTK